VLYSRSWGTLAGLTVITLLALAVMAALMLWRDRLMERLGSLIEAGFSDRLVEGLIKDNAESGGLRGVEVLRDLDTVKRFIAGPQMAFLYDLPFLPVFLAFLAVLNPWMGLTAVIGSGLLFGLTLLNERVLREPGRRALDSASRGLGDLSAQLRNAEAVIAMGMTGAVLGRWRRHHGEMLGLNDLAGDRNTRFHSLTRFYRYGFQVAMVCVGVSEVLNDVISPGAMFVGSILVGRVLTPMEGLISAWRNVIAFRQSLARVEAALDAAPSVPPRMHLPEPKGELAVQALTVQPPQASRPILRGVTFSLPAGSALGVLGPSGSGKTTLARLLVGALTPGSGSVRLDGAELSQWNPEQLGPALGYLPQEIGTFEASVREVIARLDPRAPAEAVVDAARMAGIHDLILSLPEGYDTRLGQGGVPLSGGQRQRMALARAVYGHPRLVVLDEPNSNLDVAGEQALLRALQTLKAEGATVVVVAHRHHILQAMDSLLVLRAGAVEMLGRRDEVLGRLAPIPLPRSLAAPA
ncbi:MAG: type I secretion system permease/ATPase, partial [Rhodospirillales bacterium]|nr:type I secretion system permease/ATPase [Rhodospirillales bacterium]